jgi:hypothetical protein
MFTTTQALDLAKGIVNIITSSKNNKKILEAIEAGDLETRLTAAFEKTIVQCTYYYQDNLSEDVIREILSNDTVINTITNKIGLTDFNIDKDIKLDGYGLTTEDQLYFVKSFYDELYNNVINDLALRQLIIQQKSYDLIREMHADIKHVVNIANKVDDHDIEIENIKGELTQIPKIILSEEEPSNPKACDIWFKITD